MKDLYKGFKKVNEDERKAVLKHEKGHEIVISKNGISKKQLKALSQLPLHQAEGTQVSPEEMESTQDAGQALKNVGAQITDAVAKKVVEGAEQSVSAAQQPIGPTAEELAALQQFSQQQQAPVEPIAPRPEGTPAPGLSAYKTPEQEMAAVMPSEPSGFGAAIMQPQALAPMPATERSMMQEPEPERMVSAAPAAAVKVPSEKAKTLEDVAKQVSAEPERVDEEDDYNVLADPNTTYAQKSAALARRSNETYQRMLEAEKEFRTAMEQKQFTKPELFQDKSVFGKILGVIGLALSGGGGALSGQGNLALDYLNKQIEREIETQKRNYDKDLNIHKFHMEQLKDVAQADLATANSLKQIALMEMDEKLGLTGNNPLARQRLMAARSQLTASMENDRQRLLELGISRKLLERRQQALAGEQRGGASTAPGQMRPLEQTHPALMLGALKESPNLQTKAVEEIQRREMINRSLKSMLNKFDKISATEFTPGTLQAYQAELSSLIPEVEGGQSDTLQKTIKEALSPARFTDLPMTKKIIRDAVIEYATNKSTDAAFRSTGLSLDDFQATSHDWARSQLGKPPKQEKVQRRQTMDGRVALFDQNNKFIGYE